MPTNALLIKYENGWAERTTTATPERIEAMLAVGALNSLPEVERVADGQLDVFGDPREQVTFALSPSVTATAANGDTVVTPLAAGGTSTERIQTRGVSENANGDVTVALIVKDGVLEAQEAFDQAVKKMSNGTLGGVAVVATPAVPIYIAPAT